MTPNCQTPRPDTRKLQNQSPLLSLASSPDTTSSAMVDMASPGSVSRPEIPSLHRRPGHRLHWPVVDTRFYDLSNARPYLCALHAAWPWRPASGALKSEQFEDLGAAEEIENLDKLKDLDGLVEQIK